MSISRCVPHIQFAHRLRHSFRRRRNLISEHSPALNRTLLKAGLVIVLLFGSVLALSLTAVATEPMPLKPSVIAVRPPDWSNALSEWKEYRSDRYEVIEIDSDSNPLNIREQIRSKVQQSESRGQRTVAVMLCGAVITKHPHLTTESNETSVHSTITPTFVTPTTIRFNELHTESLSTDSPFADLDDDGCPDIAIGRIPAKSSSELRRMLLRSMAYETSQDISEWRDTVHVTAGVGGFGTIADGAIETVARRYLADGLPDRFKLQMTYASLTSPYCPDPRRIKETFLGKLNQGGLFWIYIGHGWIDSLDKFKYGHQEDLLCRPEDTVLFDAPTGPPIAILLACFTGAIDAKVDCFAERLLTQPRGPVAVVAGSRVTMPYGMSEFASEMIHSCFDQGITNLGSIILEAKKSMWHGSVQEASRSRLPQESSAATSKLGTADSDRSSVQNLTAPDKRLSSFRSTVLAMARSLSPESHDLDEEKREHTRLMNLLGDPLLEIRSPKTLSLSTEESAIAGETLEVDGTTPWDGPVQIELWHHRDRTPRDLIPLKWTATNDVLYQTMDLNYEKANDLKISEQVAASQNGRFKVMLSTTPELRGKYVIRARMQSEKDWAVGTKRVTLQRPKKASPNAADSNR